MANKFEVGGLQLVVSGSVDDFHEEMKQVVMDGHVLYSPMVVTVAASGAQEIGQIVMEGRSAFTYMLIVAGSLEQFADRLMKACGEGWDVLFWYVQVDGKYLQWVSRPVDPKLSVGKVLRGVLEDAVSEFGALELPRVMGSNAQEFPGVFVKAIQKLDLVVRDQ